MPPRAVVPSRARTRETGSSGLGKECLLIAADYEPLLFIGVGLPVNGRPFVADIAAK